MATYDVITGGLTESIAYKAAPSNTEIYPDLSNVAILGQVWLPRIYGRNLTAFEIASSGKIAITVNDIHSMDISSSNMNGVLTNRFMSKSNYSIDMVTTSEKARMLLDGTSNTATLRAQESVSVRSDSNVLSMYAYSNMTLNADVDIVGTATRTISMTGQSNVELRASNTMLLNATQAMIASTSNATLNANRITETASNWTATGVSTADLVSSNVTITANDVMTANVKNTHTLNARDVITNSSNVKLTASNITHVGDPNL